MITLDAAPAWFAPAMHQILQPINTRLDALDTRLNTLEGHVIEVHRYTAVVSDFVIFLTSDYYTFCFPRTITVGVGMDP